MPLYEYRCDKCKAVVDDVRSVKERDARLHHRHCGGELRRVLSLPAPPQFKGSGFYQTDYARKT